MSTVTPLTATALRATAFKSLHVPGTPVRLANIYSPLSARAVASLPQCKALATASFALAQTLHKPDEALTLSDQLSLLPPIAAVAREFNLPLTLDIQDGYAPAGDYQSLKGLIKVLITDFGAVGVNLEDSWHEKDGGEETMMDEEEAVRRVEAVMAAARELGVDDFVVNARADTFLKGGELDESIRRARRYLKAGATTGFIFWPRSREMKREDVRRVSEDLGGMVNVGMRLGPGGITVGELAGMGVARVSVGPQVYFAVAEIVRRKAEEVFGVGE
ncbi:phosphoenolpyruvate phosphomutase-domain-containing protein [Podospora aff. communis PSN243]|uniref:Phosphoenolpyruvate phosphomutase-domain-containing protein n=1 Tax=Podospora aff. communis PSN243 TaxID=3040156 RepID=A0AAV9G9N6_9PEZI|nr:phosphoenolpyruvate phosphomutase-domain-containing protein [Podospora aff. communis PSN243]